MSVGPPKNVLNFFVLQTQLVSCYQDFLATIIVSKMASIFDKLSKAYIFSESCNTSSTSPDGLDTLDSLAVPNSSLLLKYRNHSGQEKTQIRLPRASKLCSWASENGSLVARWASETSLSSLVSDNSSQKQLKNLRLQDEQNNELKALINLKSKQT